MKVYGGIDLHSDNSVVALTDEQDKSYIASACPMICRSSSSR